MSDAATSGYFNGHITWAHLRTIVRYNKKTGRFTWVRRNKMPARVIESFSVRNGEAGAIRSNGYWYVAIDGKSYLRARLAHFYVTGYWPQEIDHKNRNTADDRWCNIREATRQTNMANTRRYSTNTSGHKGVHWDKARKKWMAHITVQYKYIMLGRFAKKSDAIRARLAAAKKLQGAFASHN